MKRNEIAVLAGDLDTGGTEKPVLLETHISWVILAGAFAYKIKKPVRFSFLDFSSLKKRKYYCERELALNRRLAPGMYLRVVPVCQDQQGFALGTKNSRIVDYAVVMSRMDTAKEMDRLLETGQVREQAILTLAARLAAFHRGARVVQRRPDIAVLRARFNDLLSVQAFAGRHLGADPAGVIGRAVQSSDRFLERSAAVIFERSAKGFVRDLHGDLHTGNVFLYEEPVIFDCIEFNEGMRELDVLDELAFLTMDIEAHGRAGLSGLLYREYQRLSGAESCGEDKALYAYYQCYRAAVRAKVQLLRARATGDQPVFTDSLRAAAVYLALLAGYLPRLNAEGDADHLPG